MLSGFLERLLFFGAFSETNGGGTDANGGGFEGKTRRDDKGRDDKGRDSGRTPTFERDGNGLRRVFAGGGLDILGGA